VLSKRPIGLKTIKHQNHRVWTSKRITKNRDIETIGHHLDEMWTRLSKLTSAFIGSKKGGSLSRSPTKNAPINDLQDENDNDVTPQKVSPPPSPPQIPSPQANANILYTKEAFTVDPITGERIEADTADSEDTLNLQTILLPSSSFPPNAKSFSVSYNKGLLDGWVKQPSPCCAAASVAGAYNGLMDLTREEAGSKGHMDVLPLMADLLKEQVRRELGAVRTFIITINDSRFTK